MKVHNIYSDILLSLSYYLNNILEGRIKTFQYNISSTSFNLDYEANYELPAAIITYNSSSYLNARPSTFLRTFSNYNQIPVLYDYNKNIGLKIQEDHFIISTDVVINCDTQLQVIDFKHLFETLIPINKYLQIYRFVSYYEIDSQYLNPYLFDVSKDKIENIFFKHNAITDELNYYFSVGYEPLIKLTSTSMNISDISTSTFSLNLSFELLMQLPSKLLFNYESPQQRNSNFDDVKFLKFDNVKVPCNSEYEYIELKIKNLHTNELFIINCPCIKDMDNFILSGTFNNDMINISLTNDTLESSYEAIVYGFIENKVVEKSTIKFQIGKLGGKFGQIIGDKISGKLKNIEIKDDEYFSAWFEGEFYGAITSFKIDNLSYEYVSDYFNIKDPHFVIPSNFKIVNFRFISNGNVFSIIKNINKFKNEIEFTHTKITGVSFYNSIDNKFMDLIQMAPVSLSKQGDFSFEVLNTIVSGNVHETTGKISISAVHTVNLEESHLKIHELRLDLVFKYFPIRGPGKVEQITINFNLTNESISNISPIEIENYSSDKYTLIIDKLNISEKDQSNRYTIQVPLPYYFNSLPTEFNFFFTNQAYTTDESKLELLLDKNVSTLSNLVFTTTERFYFNYLRQVSKLYPVFFSTLILR